MSWRKSAVAATALLLFFLLARPAGASYPVEAALLPPNVYVSPVSQYAVVGETFSAEIRVSDALDLGGFEFTLSYNPAVVTVTNIVVGGLISSTNRTVAEYGPLVNNTAGTASQIAFSYAKPARAGPNGSGLLATVTLRAVAEGTSALSLTRAQLANTNAQSQAGLTRTDGTVTVVAGARSIALSTGWNLISYDLWPRAGGQPIKEVPLVLASIEPNYSLVQSFDPVLGGLTYDPTLPFFSTLTEMDPYHGYWIKATAPCVLTLTGAELPISTPLSLATGWNLISYLPDYPQEIEASLASIAGKYSLVQGFDPILGGLTYDPTLPFFSTLTTLEPGRGYWLKMTQPGTLVYSTEGPLAAPRANARASGVASSLTGVMAASLDCYMAPLSNIWVRYYGEADLNGLDAPVGACVEAYAGSL
ncbi:MAG TPA: cohesin domain-containing protein [Anaerolineae bacterium]|nr:cohesin domain-containing protein [Anaerolineae bacterium]HQJ50575.1 cohesin domain-containing protein [Anaerolineae bacterium]